MDDVLDLYSNHEQLAQNIRPCTVSRLAWLFPLPPHGPSVSAYGTVGRGLGECALGQAAETRQVYIRGP